MCNTLPCKRITGRSAKTGIAAATIMGLAAGLVTAGSAQASIITLKASDAPGSSSFNSAGNQAGGGGWDVNAVPSGANNYYVNSGRALRTPAGNANYGFLGNSLRLGNDVSSFGQLIIKGGGNVTVGQLVLNNGTIQNNAGVDAHLGGAISGIGAGNVLDGGNTAGTSLVVSATLGGSGAMIVKAVGLAAAPAYAVAARVTLAAANSGFSGGVNVRKWAVLTPGVNAALGTGNVSVDAGGVLDLSSTNLSSAGGGVGDLAALSLGYSASDGYSKLWFGGSTLQERVGTLFVNGVAFTSGTFTRTTVSNGIDFSNYIVGDGSISVPEPGSIWLMAIATAGVLARRRRVGA